ncbi:MAG: hypothetical protein NVS9B14_13380 [Candidatus Acidiferrum sp.]
MIMQSFTFIQRDATAFHPRMRLELRLIPFDADAQLSRDSLRGQDMQQNQ